MINCQTSQVKPAESCNLRTHPTIAAALTVFAAVPALALQSPCTVNPHDAGCGFDSTLHFLRWLAVALAIILVAIIAAAVVAYRKASRAKLTPDD
jgi:hypothetical protein